MQTDPITGSSVLIDTALGRLAGEAIDGVTRFLGIPYAEAPVGALRLRSPRPAKAWPGVRNATRAGAASLQTLGGNQVWMNEPIPIQSEDCLFLNVWTPDTESSLPVLLWVHGGATRNGHGGAPGINGMALAQQQGLVVVTINYRLGALGGLAHPDLVDETTGYCANWGMQDKLMAIQWVHDNIAAFGGDPNSVTLGGQSSGGANAAIIAQHGLAHGQYHRVIVQSPPLFRPPMFVELDKAAEYTQLLADKAGVSVTQLRDMDGVELQRLEQTLASSAELVAKMGRPRTAPVRDGKLLQHWPYDSPAAQIPVLTGWTRNEANFWFDLHDADGSVISPLKPPQNPADLEKRVGGLMGMHYAFPEKPEVAAILAAYASEKDTAATWSEIYTDLVFRAPVLHFAGRQARAGQPTYVYEFAYPLPSPGRGTPHAMDVPFVFGTAGHSHFSCKVGSGPAVDRVSQSMMASWGAFVRTGSPQSDDCNSWPKFDPMTPKVMQFGPEKASSIDLPRTNGMACWAAYKA